MTIAALFLLNNKMPLFWLQNSYNSYLSSFSLSSGQIVCKKIISEPKHRPTDVTRSLMYFFSNSQVLCKNINTTQLINLLKQTARKCSPVHAVVKVFLKQWMGSLFFPHFKFSVTDVTHHRTDIKHVLHVLKAIIFTSHGIDLFHNIFP